MDADDDGRPPARGSEEPRADVDAQRARRRRRTTSTISPSSMRAPPNAIVIAETSTPVAASAVEDAVTKAQAYADAVAGGHHAANPFFSQALSVLVWAHGSIRTSNA